MKHLIEPSGLEYGPCSIEETRGNVAHGNIVTRGNQS